VAACACALGADECYVIDRAQWGKPIFLDGIGDVDDELNNDPV
jgi:hypothetical protein